MLVNLCVYVCVGECVYVQRVYTLVRVFVARRERDVRGRHAHMVLSKQLDSLEGCCGCAAPALRSRFLSTRLVPVPSTSLFVLCHRHLRQWSWLALAKMLTRSGSATSVLVVMSCDGQSATGGRRIGGTVTTTTTVSSSATNAAPVVNDAHYQQQQQHLEMLVVGKRGDDVALHNNNKTQTMMAGISDDPTAASPPSRRRRSSSAKSVHSLLSASMAGSRKDQVGQKYTNKTKSYIYHEIVDKLSSFPLLKLKPNYRVHIW